jgi:antitoxin (DNA-binding transcriptional repressor) of toxin-antitoxin stability system
MRRVERGESFTVTRNGKPIADLVPHQAGHETTRQPSAGELLDVLNALPPLDVEQWYRERADDDVVFGPDDIGDGVG